jgi:hypothetical protein
MAVGGLAQTAMDVLFRSYAAIAKLKTKLLTIVPSPVLCTSIVTEVHIFITALISIVTVYEQNHALLGMACQSSAGKLLAWHNRRARIGPLRSRNPSGFTPSLCGSTMQC